MASRIAIASTDYVAGPKLADIKKPYKMHPDIERELKWQGPMNELPFNLGWTTPISGSPAA